MSCSAEIKVKLAFLAYSATAGSNDRRFVRSSNEQASFHPSVWRACFSIPHLSLSLSLSLRSAAVVSFDGRVKDNANSL